MSLSIWINECNWTGMVECSEGRGRKRKGKVCFGSRDFGEEATLLWTVSQKTGKFIQNLFWGNGFWPKIQRHQPLRQVRGLCYRMVRS